MTRRRLAFTMMAMLAAPAISLSAVANATPPKFDVDGYSVCTATTPPAPGQDFDAVVSSCCVQNAGIPTPSTYGMACVAAVENQPADYRPTIVLPSRPQALTGSEENAFFGGLTGIDDPNAVGDPGDPAVGGPPMGDLDAVGNPFDTAGPP